MATDSHAETHSEDIPRTDAPSDSSLASVKDQPRLLRDGLLPTFQRAADPTVWVCHKHLPWHLPCRQHHHPHFPVTKGHNLSAARYKASHQYSLRDHSRESDVEATLRTRLRSERCGGGLGGVESLRRPSGFRRSACIWSIERLQADA